MKNLLILTSLSIFAIKGYSQNYFSSMYWDNYSIINPAASGFENKVHTNIQSMVDHGVTSPVNSIEFKKPSNYLFDFGFKLDKIKSGIGVSLISKRYKHDYAKVRNDILNLNYNYQIEFSEESKLSIGVSAGVYNTYSKRVNFPCFFCETSPQDQMEFHSEEKSFVRITSGLGVMYQIKKINLGLSVTHLNNPRVDESEFSNRIRNYYFNASYEAQVKNKWKLTYSGLIYRGDEVSYIRYYDEYNLYSEYGLNLNFRLMYNDFIYGGFFLNDNISHYNQSYGLISGITISEKYKLDYSIGSSDLDFNRYTDLTHQLSLSFVLK